MTTPWDAQIEQLMADYRRHRDEAVDMQEKVRALVATITSAKGLMTAVVGVRGDLRSVVFHSRGYRSMAPAELANVVIDTIERARRAALDLMAQGMPSAPFAGMSYGDILGGRVDAGAMLPEDPYRGSAMLFAAPLSVRDVPPGSGASG